MDAAMGVAAAGACWSTHRGRHQNRGSSNGIFLAVFTPCPRSSIARRYGFASRYARRGILGAVCIQNDPDDVRLLLRNANGFQQAILQVGRLARKLETNCACIDRNRCSMCNERGMRVASNLTFPSRVTTMRAEPGAFHAWRLFRSGLPLSATCGSSSCLFSSGKSGWARGILRFGRQPIFSGLSFKAVRASADFPNTGIAPNIPCRLLLLHRAHSNRLSETARWRIAHCRDSGSQDIALSESVRIDGGLKVLGSKDRPISRYNSAWAMVAVRIIRLRTNQINFVIGLDGLLASRSPRSFSRYPSSSVRNLRSTRICSRASNILSARAGRTRHTINAAGSPGVWTFTAAT